MTTEKTAKAGDLITLESGSYSDYGVDGLYRVLKDFQPLNVLAVYAAKHGKVRSYTQNKGQKGYGMVEVFTDLDKNAFAAWLLANGYLEEVKYGQFYTGDNSIRFELKECSYTPPSEE